LLVFAKLIHSMTNDDRHIRRSLARAFDRAWDGYYRAARLTVSQDVARTELARRLVQLSKQGVRGGQPDESWPKSFASAAVQSREGRTLTGENGHCHYRLQHCQFISASERLYQSAPK
jgi:hypothetical protein